jgi:hypothetical protein
MRSQHPKNISHLLYYLYILLPFKVPEHNCLPSGLNVKQVTSLL